jgi:23S rRNA (guanine745-N1)-methyltransferase
MALEETSRVLKKNACFIVVYPDRNHLFGLKRMIYDTPYKNEPEDTHLSGFEQLYEERVAYTITVEGRDRASALFMMTPYAYRTGRAERERALALDSVTTEVEFCINVYKKV